MPVRQYRPPGKQGEILITAGKKLSDWIIRISERPGIAS